MKKQKRSKKVRGVPLAKASGRSTAPAGPRRAEHPPTPSRARARADKRIPKMGDHITILSNHPWKPFHGKTVRVQQVIELRNGGYFLGFAGGGVKTGSYRYAPATGIAAENPQRVSARIRSGKPGASSPKRSPKP